jgi:hypothetical protein
MKKLIQLAVILVFVSGLALAARRVDAPELDGGSAATALGLLAGAALMIRTKR